MVKFDKVIKKFGTNDIALDKISLTVSTGEFAFLVGPSGVGKTTLLRLIRRDLLPTSGRIMVDRWEVNELPSKKVPTLRRKVAMVFQDFKVLTDRTAYENISVALEVQRKKDKEIKRAVTRILELVGLEKKAEAFPVQLSAGELQRISIARAMVGKPKVLLADEPTGNLDFKTGWNIIKLLVDINKLGTTVIMATHNLDIVNSMNKRVIVLRKGKVIRDKKEKQ